MLMKALRMLYLRWHSTPRSPLCQRKAIAESEDQGIVLYSRKRQNATVGAGVSSLSCSRVLVVLVEIVCQSPALFLRQQTAQGDQICTNVHGIMYNA